MSNLKNRTIFITGATRGIGRDGASIVVTGKAQEPNPKVAGTIHSTAREAEQADGLALPLQLDVRDENAVADAVKTAAEKFGGIDILVNNASATSISATMTTPAKRHDLMNQINARGAFVCSQACIPHLSKSGNAPILTLSPPLNMNQKWFKEHVANTIAKCAMSICTLGTSAEFGSQGIAMNSLWPRTTIATAVPSPATPSSMKQCFAGTKSRISSRTRSPRARSSTMTSLSTAPLTKKERLEEWT